MVGFAALCLLAGMFPGVVIDALAPVVQQLVGGRHAGAARPALAVDGAGRRAAAVPTTALLVFLFVVASPPLTARSRAPARPRARCAARRRGIAAIPTSARRRNTRAASFPSRSAGCSAPLLFRARETVAMPPPGDLGPAQHPQAHARSGLGTALHPDVRRRAGAGRAVQPLAVPHHPPLSRFRLHRPGRCCCWRWRYGNDRRLARWCRACRWRWCCCSRRC